MVVRKRELSFDDLVASETQVRLRFAQEFVAKPALFGRPIGNVEKTCLRSYRLSSFLPYCLHQMGRMTGLASYSMKLMFRSVEQRLFMVRDVAGQTAVRILRC